MGDDARFSEACLRAVNMLDVDGSAMVAVSRAILRNDYSDEDYEKEFFSIFILIDEETGNIVLDGFGEFNTASQRYSLDQDHIRNLNKVLFASSRADSWSNSRLYHDDLTDIARSYRDQFDSSLRAFKAYFGLPH
jgi:hypothetical protein